MCLRCAVTRAEFKVDVLAAAEFCLQIFPSEDFQPLVESTVVEFAVLFYLPEILGRDSPTVNVVIKPVFMNKTQSFAGRWQSVAWKPKMHFDVTTLDDVKADTNQTR